MTDSISLEERAIRAAREVQEEAERRKLTRERNEQLAVAARAREHVAKLAKLLGVNETEVAVKTFEKTEGHWPTYIHVTTEVTVQNLVFRCRDTFRPLGSNRHKQPTFTYTELARTCGIADCTRVVWHSFSTLVEVGGLLDAEHRCQNHGGCVHGLMLLGLAPVPPPVPSTP